MVSVEFNMDSPSEQDAFLGAFFKFVEAASIQNTDSFSVRADTHGANQVKVVTFEDHRQADQFRIYWTRRRAWLGLGAEPNLIHP